MENELPPLGLTSGRAVIPWIHPTPEDLHAIWRAEYLAAWAEIGWHAKVDGFLRLFDTFAMRTFNTLGAHDEAIRDQNGRLDNHLIDIRKLMHKVRP
jgi:hypothetical protein